MLRAPFALIWNLLKLLPFVFRAFFFWLGHLLTRKQKKWVRVKLPKRMTFGPPSGLASYFQDKVSYLELRDNLEVVANDERIEGVVVTADHLMHGAGRAADLRTLIRRLRDAGKSVVFHTHGVHGREYDLATEADEILISPGGRFYMFGQRFEQFFAAPLLEKLGVVAQFVHIGPFKGAAHRFIHEEGTEPVRLMMDEVVDDLSRLREERICTRRQINDQILDDAFQRMPLDDRDAHALGLVDARIHRPMIARWIAEGEEFVDNPALAQHVVASAAGEQDQSETDPEQPAEEPVADPGVSMRDANRYADAHPGPYRWTPLFRPRRHIAILDLSGMIVMPDMELPGHSLATIDPSEVLPALRQLATDRRVAAVVIHINSPGGSALASELIWDGIRRLRHQKPTVAYCSDIAASGGYYLAVGTDRIVCQPETITGSIGVVAGKFSFPGTLEKLEVGAEAHYRHDTSVFQSLSEPLSEQVLENLRRDARSFYRQFLRRVGDARQLPHRRLHRYARGRIYTGNAAAQRSLVDHLGGFDDAVEIARSLAEPALPDSAPVTFHSHRRVSLPALMRKSMSAPSLWNDLVADAAFIKTLVERDPLLALMPYRPALRI